MRKSVGEEIAEAATKPLLPDYDIEDETIFEHAEHSSSGDESENDVTDGEKATEHYLKVSESKLRKNIDRVDVQDAKYEGSVGSRSKLFADDSSSDGAMSFRTDSEDELIVSAEENSSMDEEESSREEEESLVEDNRQRLERLAQQDAVVTVSRLSETTHKDAAKGLAVVEQSKMFDGIIDTRIKLQKSLTAANHLPLTSNSWNDLLKEEDKKQFKETTALLLKVLQQMVTLRSKFQEKNDISSKTPEVSKKRSLEQLGKNTVALDNDLSLYGKEVLQKWSIKIDSASGNSKLSTAKFKTINQSADVQVESQLADMTRLVKRTRLNRKGIEPLRFAEDMKFLTELQQPAQSEEVEDIDIPQNYDPRRKDNLKNGIDTSENPYIFDDEDFYRVLLNDLVEKKISVERKDGGAIIAMTSKSNNKSNKKNIDTKASKGRKLNYSIQEPIASYETPISSSYDWTDEQIDEFFAGLLGRKVNFSEEEEIEEEDDIVKQDDIKIFG